MRIGGDGDLDPGRVREPRVLGGKIEAVGARIDLEKTTILPGVADDPLDVNFIAGTFQQQTPVACPRILKYRLSIARMMRSVCSAFPRPKREWMEQTV